MRHSTIWNRGGFYIGFPAVEPGTGRHATQSGRGARLGRKATYLMCVNAQTVNTRKRIYFKEIKVIGAIPAAPSGRLVARIFQGQKC